jgi:hypothetical protein
VSIGYLTPVWSFDAYELTTKAVDLIFSHQNDKTGVK